MDAGPLPSHLDRRGWQVAEWAASRGGNAQCLMLLASECTDGGRSDTQIYVCATSPTLAQLVLAPQPWGSSHACLSQAATEALLAATNFRAEQG
jgi:hypothetical protein